MLIREPLYEAKLSIKPHESGIPAFARMTEIGGFLLI